MLCYHIRWWNKVVYIIMLTNDFRLELCHKLFRHGRSIALSNTWTFTTFTALWLDRRCYTLTHYKDRYAVIPVLRFVVDLLCNFFLQLQRRGNQGGRVGSCPPKNWLVATNRDILQKLNRQPLMKEFVSRTQEPRPVLKARCYASAVLACVRLSVCVCLSVTSRCSTKTAKRRITQTTPHDTPGTLVFWSQRSPRNSTGVTPCGAPNADGVAISRKRYKIDAWFL